MYEEYADRNRPWVLGKRIQSARIRCLNIAESERLLGYEDTCKLYREIAGELEYLSAWVIGQIYNFESLPPAA